MSTKCPRPRRSKADLGLVLVFIACLGGPVFADVTNLDNRQSDKTVGNMALGGSVVANMGTYTTSIPIAGPPGTKGVAPNLSITYNSHGGNGDAGKGWALSGVSSIARDRSHGAYNAQSWSLTQAVFLLNGQRLVRNAAANDTGNGLGCLSTRYYTEIDNFQKILLCEGSGVDADSYWLIVAKDGTRTTFGYLTGANSKFLSPTGQALEYYQDEVRTPTGLSWRATYSGYDTVAYSAPRLEKVEYTYLNGAVLGQPRLIDILWQPRDDKQVDFFFGFWLLYDQRIRAIETQLGGVRVSKYVLTYDADVVAAGEQRSRDSDSSMLYSVQRFGVTDSDALPAVTFAYQSNVGAGPGFATTATTLAGNFTTPASEPGTCGTRKKDYMDLNGDGWLDDVDASYAKHATSPRWEVKYGIANGGFSSTVTNWTLVGGGTMPYIQELPKPSSGCDGDISPAFGWPNVDWSIADMNGDGKPDLYGQGNVSPGEGRVYMNNGSGFNVISWAEPTHSTYLSGNATEHRARTHDDFNTSSCRDDDLNTVCQTSTKAKSLMTDADSDGCADRFELDYHVGTPSLPYWRFYRNKMCDPTPSNGFAAAVTWTWPSGFSAPDYFSHDLDDVSYYTYDCSCHGNQCQQIPPAACCVCLRTVQKIRKGRSWGFIQLNGDGLMDFMDQNNNVFFGTGKGFVWQPPGSIFNYYAPTPGNSVSNLYEGAVNASLHYDINGDGLRDHLFSPGDPAYHSNGCTTKAPGPWNWQVRLNNGRGFSAAIDWLATSSAQANGELAWIHGGKYSTYCDSGAYAGVYKWDHQLRDADGDGLLEVVRSTNQAFKNASLNHPDLLATINNGIGGTTTVAYTTLTGGRVGGSFGTPRVAVASVSANDGMGSTMITSYNYALGYFDPTRRQFLGFGWVQTRVSDGDTGTPDPRSTTVYANGDPSRLIGDTETGHISEPTYCTRETFRDAYELAGKPFLMRTGTYLMDHEILTRWKVITSGPVKTVIKDFDRGADTAPTAVTGRRWIQTNYQYDQYGNLTKKLEYGESRFATSNAICNATTACGCYTDINTQETICPIDGSYQSDERYSLTTYAQNTGAWIFVPSEVRTCTDSACSTPSAMLASVRTFYDDLPVGQVGSIGNVSRLSSLIRYGTDADAWSTVQNTYDSDGINIVGVTDPMGAVITYEYKTPSRAYLTSTSRIVRLGKGANPPAVLTATDVWDERFGLATQGTDGNGHITATLYDGLGRITATQSSPPDDPTGALITLSTISYSLGGVTSSPMNSLNYTLTRSYLNPAGDTQESIVYGDGFGRTIQAKTQTDGLNWTAMNQRYRSQGVDRSTLPYYTTSPAFTSFDFSVSPPSQPVNRTSFNSSGRVTASSLITPAGSAGNGASVYVTTTSYSNHFWTVTATTPAGNRKTSTNNAYGNVIKVEEQNAYGAVQATTTYAYDALGRMTRVTDSSGNIVRASYDSLGRKRTLEDEDASNCAAGAPTCPLKYYYDAKSRLIRQTNAAGDHVEITYDEADRPYLKNYSSAEADVSSEYDMGPNALGKLSKVTKGADYDSFSFDNWGRTTSSTRSTGGTVGATASSFDWAGQLLSIRYPNGDVARYSYNKSGYLLTSSLTTGGSTKGIVTNALYDSLGRAIQIDWGNTTKTLTDYFSDYQKVARMRVQDGGGVNLIDLNYTYTTDGNPQTIIEYAVTPNWKREYAYDWADRLTTANHYIWSTNTAGWGNGTGSSAPQKAWSYGYSAIGNMTANSSWTVGGSSDYIYAEGNAGPHALTHIGTGTAETFTYDINGNMASKRNGAITYTYDLDGRMLTGHDTTASPHLKAEFKYSGTGERIQKLWLSTDNTVHDLRYFGTHYEEHRVGVTNYRDRYALLGGVRAVYFTETRPTKYYFMHPDVQGTIGLATDETGVVVLRREFRPFGEIESSAGTDPGLRYSFSGEEHDTESKLIHLGVREYDPQTARWPQPDDLVKPLTPQSLNRYSYALNNPLRYTDPSGFEAVSNRPEMIASPARLTAQDQAVCSGNFICETMVGWGLWATNVSFGAGAAAKHQAQAHQDAAAQSAGAEQQAAREKQGWITITSGNVVDYDGPTAPDPESVFAAQEAGSAAAGPSAGGSTGFDFVAHLARIRLGAFTGHRWGTAPSLFAPGKRPSAGNRVGSALLLPFAVENWMRRYQTGNSVDKGIAGVGIGGLLLGEAGSIISGMTTHQRGPISLMNPKISALIPKGPSMYWKIGRTAMGFGYVAGGYFTFKDGLKTGDYSKFAEFMMTMPAYVKGLGPGLVLDTMWHRYSQIRDEQTYYEYGSQNSGSPACYNTGQCF